MSVGLFVVYPVVPLSKNARGTVQLAVVINEDLSSPI